MSSIRLTTDRLVLRPLEAEEARAAQDFASRNRAHFGPWEPARSEEYFTLEFWREALAKDHQAIDEDRRYRLFAHRLDTPDEIVALVHFSNIVRGAFSSCHLGFGIDAAHEGQGLMREATQAAIDWVFDDRGLHRIEANHRPENTRSARLLERLGFIPEGYSRRYLFIDGEWRDHVRTASINPRWNA